MKMKYFCFSLIGICSLFCTVCACSTGEAFAAGQILGVSSEAPVFLACKAASETEIDFEFSRPVKVVSLRFSPELAVGSVEHGSTVKVNIDRSPGPGERLTADLLAEDERGNTINVLVPLRTRNNRIPAMRINELRTEYSKPKAEFIELKMLEAGNLGALRVYIAGNYKSPLVYEFASVEVAEGDYVLLHLRTVEEANRDEYGENLDESGGAEAVAGIRDFWIPGTSKLLHKLDAVYVVDQDDKVIDAVMLANSPDPWWNKEYLAEAADLLFKQGAWKSAEGKTASPAAGAVNTGTTTATRSICRDETTGDTNTATDWYVTVSSGVTPGKLNNPKRYVK
ncbi:MAG: hypothetical protein LBK62_03185 [Treponema sp.]|jgi:hypothetical protein|nr:hypothetical protein [Treponema sp.]